MFTSIIAQNYSINRGMSCHVIRLWMISIPSACDTVADMEWFDFSIVDMSPEIPFSEYALAVNNFFKIFKVDMSRKRIGIMNPSFYNRNVGLSRIRANEKKET